MVLLTSQVATVFADTNNKVDDENLYAGAVSYSAYSKANSDASRNEKTIKLDLAAYSGESKLVSISDGILLWKDGEGELSFAFQVQSAGLFNLKTVWKPIDTGLDISLGVKLDGEFPFEEAEEIILKRVWENKTDEPRTDEMGNEYAQEQVETGDFIEEILHDNTGIANAPYEFYLSKGMHVLTLVAPEQGIKLSELSFVMPEKTDSYEKVFEKYESLDTKAQPIIIQAEDAD